MMAASANDSLAKLSPGQRNVLMAADPEYLRNTLRAIDAKYGSFETIALRNFMSPTAMSRSSGHVS
jgi:hypothetical protein